MGSLSLLQRIFLTQGLNWDLLHCRFIFIILFLDSTQKCYHMIFGSDLLSMMDFAGSSVGKETTYNAGDPGLIPGSGRSPGEGIGHPLQYSWASLVPQLVKNLPAMWETWVRSLGWEDPLEKGKATHSSILAWRIPWACRAVGHY